MRVRNDGRIGNEREIVPIKRDIQFSDRDAGALDLFNVFRQTLGERDAAGLDADETEIFGAVILLDDLADNYPSIQLQNFSITTRSFAAADGTSSSGSIYNVTLRIVLCDKGGVQP